MDTDTDVAATSAVNRRAEGPQFFFSRLLLLAILLGGANVTSQAIGLKLNDVNRTKRRPRTRTISVQDANAVARAHRGRHSLCGASIRRSRFASDCISTRALRVLF